MLKVLLKSVRFTKRKKNNRNLKKKKKQTYPSFYGLNLLYLIVTLCHYDISILLKHKNQDVKLHKNKKTT